ncbi:MAG: hypothetical protein ABI559_02925 [Chloroflexota bacterium]
MIPIVILVIVLLVGIDTAAIFIVRRNQRMDRLAFAEIDSRIQEDETVLFRGSLSRMLLGFWPYVPASGAAAVTNRRLLWQQGEGVPVPFLLRTALDIPLTTIDTVSNPSSVNPDMVLLAVEGKELRLFLNSLAGPKFTEENQRKASELTAALHQAKAKAK